MLVVGVLEDVQQQQVVAGAEQVVRRPPQRLPATLREVHREAHPPLAIPRHDRRFLTCWMAGAAVAVEVVATGWLEEGREGDDGGGGLA